MDATLALAAVASKENSSFLRKVEPATANSDIMKASSSLLNGYL
jgi:hypothetical protein